MKLPLSIWCLKQNTTSSHFVTQNAEFINNIDQLSLLRKVNAIKLDVKNLHAKVFTDCHIVTELFVDKRLSYFYCDDKTQTRGIFESTL